MFSRAFFAVVCGVCASVGEARADVPHRWTFRLVARTGPLRVALPLNATIPGGHPAIAEDGSVVVRYQATGPDREGLLVYDAANGATRTIAERAGTTGILTDLGLDFHTGLIAFVTRAGTTEVWTKEGSLVRTISSGGPEQIIAPFVGLRFGDGGSLAYRAPTDPAVFGPSHHKYIIERFDQPRRSQLRVAASTLNASYAVLGVPAIGDGQFFAGRVTMRANSQIQIRRWEGSPLPVQPVVVAREGQTVGFYRNVFEPLSINRHGQVAFWVIDGDSGPRLVRATSEADQRTMAGVNALASSPQLFAPSIAASGIVAFGSGGSTLGHFRLVVCDDADFDEVAAWTFPLPTQLGTFTLNQLPAIVGTPVMNDQHQIVFIARLIDQSDTLIIAQPLSCAADFNGDQFVDPDDLADFVTCFFQDVLSTGACPAADFNGDGSRDPDDLSDFVTAFFTLDCAR